MTSPIPHRRQLVQRLKDYPKEHARFLELTREEYYRNLEPIHLPTDSVASARIDGMPHAAVAMASNPTLRIVISREAILERLQAQRDQLSATITRLTDRLFQFWDWWTTLTDVQRWFVQWRWWEGATYEQVARNFLADGDRFRGYVPDSVKKVLRFEEELLADLEALWYGDPLADESEDKN
ncbi:hypothetical protein [Sulfobacillus harzensis]|uniref:Uncharacterized protein n=1 Tax=Sulfobacillus harzensis TaxID=2729629 RepID=A0A7Y0LA13_9FIRM|nr:hypothetical protein [Sulfobacillus harzensis]NMP24624.1 hypothetical protein [Sulfobacillus harzensis]